MSDGITIRILGDYGPFSRIGKSVGYQVTIGQSSFLVDCGSPLFQQIGGHGLKDINGLIITHCHDDHKRWFTDLALFNLYALKTSRKTFLLTAENIYSEIIRSSGPALDRSLSLDSKSVVDVSYDNFIDYRVLGPRARYRIVSQDDGMGKTGIYVADRDGNHVSPDIAKVVISLKTKRPRMLFKDPFYKEWVEPESFYPFSSTVFYEEDRNAYIDKSGFTIEATVSPVWHGITGIGLIFRTAEETLIFSSDTAHNTVLWKQLYTEKRAQTMNMTRMEFESSSVIYGDINDYIERAWSEERYMDAVNAFNDAMVIHDIAATNSVVHTDYDKLSNTTLKKENVILTHSPDKMTSEWVLCNSGKTFRVKGKKFFEVVGDRLYPMNADVYHRESGRYYVGYRNESGRHTVYGDSGLLWLSCEDGFEFRKPGRPLYRVDLYEDISGKYFPKLDNKNAIYYERKDGKVELTEFTEEGSVGRVVESHRDRFL